MAFRKYLDIFVLSALIVAMFSGATPAPAQVSISIGAAPVCPYGYYDYAPYRCSPYGYYGPDWFSGGLFIGTGPWYHGSRGFYGHVDNRYSRCSRLRITSREDESAEALCGAGGPSFRPRAGLSQRLEGRVVQVDERNYGSGAILLRPPVILSLKITDTHRCRSRAKCTPMALVTGQIRRKDSPPTDELHENAVNNAVLFRSVFNGPLLSAAAYTPDSAVLAIEQEHADAIVFGRLFIANPDLVERVNGSRH
jgi:NADH:flavin oxidoreductase / NADH oxidase family